MGNKVFANGREISCKADSGKSICAFPDVCMTPPQTPATPPGVPIPYPNTGMSSDTDGGSKKVKISGKEVMLKNKSSFKKSTGDEAGSAPKKGLITGVNKGKVFFTSWAMDVKFEGENVVRHLDMTTHNHASDPGDTPPWPFTNSADSGQESKCEGEKQREKDACQEYKPKGTQDVCEVAGLKGPVIQGNQEARDMGLGYNKSSDWADATAKKASANDCIQARRCQLVPYDGPDDGIGGCCKSQTPDHLIPKASFYNDSAVPGDELDDWPKYDPKKAPCMCTEGGSNTAGNHGLRHAKHKSLGIKKGTPRSFDKEAKDCAEGASEVFSAAGCTVACLEEQLKNGHEKMGDTKKDVKHAPSGKRMTDAEISAKGSQLGATTVAE